jgi:triosephosphate isomerase
MSLPRKIIIGNWKLNETVAEGTVLLHKIHQELKGFSTADVVVCPPATHLYSLHREAQSFKTNPQIQLGAQNISAYEAGAHTGEVSAAMVQGLAKYTIVGHSERRLHYGETDEDVALKIAIALRHSLVPILCVGETEQQRKDGKASQAILDELNTDLANVTSAEVKNIIIAYEPIWAIGNGNFAKPAQIEDMLRLIRNTLVQRLGSLASLDSRVIYGGSVDGENAKAILHLQGCDGALVGGASLRPKDFARIVQATSLHTGISA